MHDQPIQLDTSFDTSPTYTVASWLRTIDNRVVNGEPIVIIDDGTTQRVITAPCTGRIVDVYTEVGARILPRTVLGMVRPDLVLPEINHGIGSIAMGVIMIALALVIVPLLGNRSQANTTNTTQSGAIDATQAPDSAAANVPVNTPTTDSPMPDAPPPGSSPDEGLDQPVTEEVPPPPGDEPNDTAILPDSNPPEEPNPLDLASATQVPDESNTDPSAFDQEPPVDDTGTQDAGSDTQTYESINEQISVQFIDGLYSIIDLVLTTESSYPSGPISQAEYDDYVSPNAAEAQSIVDNLANVVAQNNDNPDINEKSRTLFSLFKRTETSCLEVFALYKQAAASDTEIPDLTDNITQCYTVYDDLENLP